MELLLHGKVIPHGAENFSNVHIWQDNRTLEEATQDDDAFLKDRQGIMEVIISDKLIKITTEEEFEEAEADFLACQCTLMQKASTLVNSRNIHKAQVVLEEIPVLRSDESEGREYYEFRFQLLSPYKFDENMDAARINLMLKSFRSNNKELIKETEDEVFSRFLNRLSIWYAADKMNEDEEEENV